MSVSFVDRLSKDDPVMADPDNRDTPQPMSDADIVAPPADTEFQPAEPLKNTGTEFEAGDAGATTHARREDASSSGAQGGIAGAKQALIDGTANLRGQAGDKARDFAVEGKTRATDALGQLSQLLNDAAGQVDEKLGAQYGQYARTAADKVQGFSSTIDAKDVDELIEDARALVRKSPAVAIGAAAAVGFVVARLITAGIDQRDA
jgi:ElaB/YqjD/DUF883 family membrane-anchored ribosome-binding protein